MPIPLLDQRPLSCLALPSIYLSIYLPHRLSDPSFVLPYLIHQPMVCINCCLPDWLTDCPLTHLSIYLSIYLPTYPFTYLSTYLQRQNCNGRKEWSSIKDTRVPLLNIFGLQVTNKPTNKQTTNKQYTLTRLLLHFLTYIFQHALVHTLGHTLSFIFSFFYSFFLSFFDQVALGNVNFHEEIYRPCVMHETGGLPYCP